MPSCSIQNEDLQLSVNPATARWNVYSNRFQGSEIDGLAFGLDCSIGGDLHSWRGEPRLVDCQISRLEDKDLGLVQTLNLSLEMEDAPIRLAIRFKLADSGDLLRWQIRITNIGDDEIQLERLFLLKAGDPPRSWWKRLLDRPKSPKAPHSVLLGGFPADFWFMDGWQSWSFAGSIKDEKLVTGTRLGPATAPMYFNPHAPRPRSRSRFSSDMYAIIGNRKTARGILIGQLRELHAYGTIEGWIEESESGFNLINALEGKRVPPGGSWESDPGALQFLDLSQPEPHLGYIEAVGVANDARTDNGAPPGWSSWYYYFDDIHQEEVIENVDWIKANQQRLPLNLVQLDDGYQADIGDWLEVNSNFSESHEHLTQKISDAGLVPGLWLAPFIAKPSSKLVADHPDWILRKANGRPVRAGYNWGTFFVALDVTHPEVEAYLAQVIEQAVKEWGYRYLKLDFLYAASLLGQRWQADLTGAEALRRGLEIIRQAAGEEVYLAGCGCPLGPAIGIVDSMRIGPDVAPRWQPAYQGIETYFKHEPSLPSLRNALQNSLTRAIMHGRWWQNDADNLLMRKRDTHLTANEVQLMATVVALSGGTMIFSDDLTQLDEDRVDWASSLLPPMKDAPFILDQFERVRPQTVLMEKVGPIGQWWLLALINWSRGDQMIHFKTEKYPTLPEHLIGLDYWRGEIVEIDKGELALTVPGHGVRLLQLRADRSSRVQWLGDTLHISGGDIIKDWSLKDSSVEATVDLQRRASGSAWLQLPGRLRRATLDGNLIAGDPIGGGRYQFLFNEISRSTLRLSWD